MVAVLINIFGKISKRSRMICCRNSEIEIFTGMPSTLSNKVLKNRVQLSSPSLLYSLIKLPSPFVLYSLIKLSSPPPISNVIFSTLWVHYTHQVPQSPGGRMRKKEACLGFWDVDECSPY
ncbi:hypothetical protein NPIL_131611 [Nephila pilipes]|uniref:Uncharacterized protein n=1 Tax=Nephila pilipes TaxID=299642 RepID=A0A8X6QI32_NEPPI|nr:hypothetical protein NPIL_131611 [Nephila pilipes]